MRLVFGISGLAVTAKSLFFSPSFQAFRDLNALNGFPSVLILKAGHALYDSPLLSNPASCGPLPAIHPSPKTG